MNKAIEYLEKEIYLLGLGEWTEDATKDQIEEHDKKVEDYKIALKILKENLGTGERQLTIPDDSGEHCPICKSDDLVDIDDHYTKCCKCGFSFVG